MAAAKEFAQEIDLRRCQPGPKFAHLPADRREDRIKAPIDLLGQANDDPPPIEGIPCALDETRTLQPIDEAGHSARRQAGSLGDFAGGDTFVFFDEAETA